MKPTTLFALEDRIFKLPGLYTLWTCLFISNVVVLLTDSTVGACRDFNVWTNALSVLYCGFASLNTIYGNGKPSTMLLTVGPIHQYAYWLLFAYYKPDKILGDHPIGIINWLFTVVVGCFTLDMIFKTWYITLYPDTYKQYLKESSKESVSQVEESVISV